MAFAMLIQGHISLIDIPLLFNRSITVTDLESLMEHAQCRKVVDCREFVNPDKGCDAGPSDTKKSDVIEKVTLSRARPGK